MTAVRIDPRETYLKRMLTLDRSRHMSFLAFVNLVRLFLQNPGVGKENVEVSYVEEAIADFLHEYRSEKGVPSLEWMLYELDLMQHLGKRWLKVKTRKTCKKFLYPEVLFRLRGLEDYLMFLVRQRTKEVRIMNPEFIM